MRLISSFLLFFVVLSFAQQPKQVPVFTVSGLTPYEGMFISAYLVSSSNSFLGTSKNINKVYEVLESKKIDSNEIKMESASELRSSGIKPNAVTVIIHPSKDHALNRFELTPHVGVKFKAPLYENKKDKVNATQENMKYIKRITIDLEELKREGILKI